jgi:hypothetical protein
LKNSIFRVDHNFQGHGQLSRKKRYRIRQKGWLLCVQPRQSIGGGNDQRKTLLPREVRISCEVHFPSFSTQSAENSHSRDRCTRTLSRAFAEPRLGLNVKGIGILANAAVVVIACEFGDLDLADARDQRQMIIRATLGVTAGAHSGRGQVGGRHPL